MNPEIVTLKKMRRYRVFFQLDHEKYPSKRMIASNKMDIVHYFRQLTKGCHVIIEKIEEVKNEIH